ncbi:transglycosylase domain-containing protein [Hamadaea tsunoensis]|uniref:transglycosylase domain-containing protein n=1 Tax=Hamadaea tsunoensis TaxID=53368 RepID=UPI000419181D|nr:transglycosylase domain-containing protein [Hamadaea tsunoensis]
MTSDADNNQPAPDADVLESHPVRTRKRRSRRKTLLVALTVLVVLLAGGAVAGTLYVDSIDELLPESLPVPQVTTIFAADGTTQLAQLGTENRSVIPMDILPEKVRQALIAGEDKDFFEGSATASTLTREYIRLATQASDDSNSVKLREVILARKLEDKYTKLEILGFFLNLVEFGRGAVGVEKAAEAYFGKSARDLTVAEAAVLGGIIKAPYGDQAGPSIYDPQAHPAEAKARWTYVLDSMVDKGWLTAAERDQLQLPQVRDAATVSSAAQWGIKIEPGTPAGKATGNVLNYVFAELAAQGISPDELRTGGYRITTSIDPQAQALLETQSRPDLPGSQLAGRKAAVGQDLQAAGVVLDNATGRVLAYYGGLDGTGTDVAGLNVGGPKGSFGGHPAGATMEVYSLAAALESGASLKSRWRGAAFTTEEGAKIGNSTAAPCADYCSLQESFTAGYNVPFYWVARQIGPGTIVKTAQRAGITRMWTAEGREMLGSGSAQDDTARAPFDRPVGYGAYPVTVLDNAAGVATIANGGRYNAPHFVFKVERKDTVTGEFRIVPGAGERLRPVQAVRRQVADDVTYAMGQTAQAHGFQAAAHGRPIAVQTGSWTATDDAALNSDAWTVGFTRQLTVAVWTGNAAGSVGVVDPVGGGAVTGNGAPYRIWSGFVSAYSEAKGMAPEKLADPAHVGRDDFPGANGVAR